MEKIREQIMGNMDRLLSSPVAIYPYGKNGKYVKSILESELYPMNDLLIVDNHLADSYQNIIRFEDVPDPGKYLWIITVQNTNLNLALLTELQKKVNKENILNLFPHILVKKGIDVDKCLLLSQALKNPHRYIQDPCPEMMDLVGEKKNERKALTIAEIGVGFGITALCTCELLDENDTYYCFDFQDTVDNLVHDLEQIDTVKCNIVGLGNTYKKFDSYNWNLAKLAEKNTCLFDIAYLDGVHSFAHDGLACCLLKEMIKPEGYLVFDDVFFRYGGIDLVNRSVPKYAREILNDYTQEQLDDSQVLRVVSLFMDRDPRFKKIERNEWTGGRFIYQRTGV